MGISRRKFLAGLAATGTMGALAPVETALARRRKTVTLPAVATRTGEYPYLPFEVPRRAKRLDVKLTSEGTAKVGVGLFDHRGAGYQSPGFRGVYGEERSEFYVSAKGASRSFLPGRVEAGEWTVIVPVFFTAGPSRITVTVAISLGSEGRVPPAGPEPGVVNPDPGWYRGDLHCHTVESSDARASGSAFTPKQWADEARRIGLDWVSLTDHNVTTQNRNLKEDSGEDVLLLGGEEMTNWFHGHATVTGLPPEAWLDWRQRPAGVPLGPNEERIQRFIAEAKRLDTYTAAAHPAGAQLYWQFFADAEADPAALPDGLEVWNGPFQPDDEATLEKWDDLLRDGRRIFASGGSDTHGVENEDGFAPGYPTTVVYADSLSNVVVVAALKADRGFITRTPEGAEVYLSAALGGRSEIVGGTVYGTASDVVEVSTRVVKGVGMRLVLLRDGNPVQTTRITADPQTVTFPQPIGTGGYVRVELRGEPYVDPNPRASRLDMEVLTNPIFVVAGPRPTGTEEPQQASPISGGTS